MALLLGHPAFQRLGETLIAFLWQGALVALLLACVNALLSRRDAGRAMPPDAPRLR